MTQFAVGVTVFLRTRRLEQLLDSIRLPEVSKVYVADVGDSADREHLYDAEYPFELEPIDLEHGAGVSRGRNSIVERLDEEYLLLVDSDNRIPDDAPVLARQLEERPRLGGVAGSLLEPEVGRLYQPACDLAEYEGGLIKSSRIERKQVESVAGRPFVPFDFVPNAVMFRRACLEEYRWDPKFVNHKEHIDFFVGHWKRTDWQFGVCPTVFFEHYPGGDETYTDHRFDETAFREQGRYFHEKWGYDFLKSPHGNWFDTHKVSSDPTMGPRDLVSELPMTPGEALESVPQEQQTGLASRAYQYYRNEGLLALARRAAHKLKHR